jgi:RND family efflux transporter MFP subunit
MLEQLISKQRLLAHAVSLLLLPLLPAMVQAAEYPALLDWSGRVTLTLPVSGVLNHVAAQAGQTVKQGELLASLEPSLFKAGVAEARADIDRLNQEQVDAHADQQRVQELYARTVTSTTELEAANLRFARANASLAAAQAQLERARRLLVETELRAPFDVVVLQRHAEPGLVISSQCQPAPVFTVARADELLVRASLTPTQIAAMGASGRASLHLDSEAEVILGEASQTGKIKSLTSSSDQLYRLEVSIPRSASMFAGQPARIRLP